LLEQVGDLTDDDLLAFLDSEAVPDLGEGEFSISDFARRKGWSHTRAMHFLANKEAGGLLESGPRHDPRSGRRVKGYWVKR